ncbi:hypothetical protein UH38_13065 [Aliterella atlantica CENA595]|uniref:Helix-turn-helix type 11 domain-containing protein n=2 Tax=Aliterella TaxID=1827277 RepID=A0A0D8ZVH3_9CYAN|nr:hypothetical protein UH38_13065 [Aliterella atlantica CENA595]
MEEHLKACRELNSTQRAVYYYLQILGSDGSWMNFTAQDIQDIAADLGISKRTLYSALKVLGQLGWIEYNKPTGAYLVSFQQTRSF